MSILSLPRITFSGKTEWNPDTTNNYDTYYDSTTAAPVPPNATRDDYLGTLKSQVTDQGNWNLYGDHAVRFVDTTISSIQLQSGRVASDPLLGKPTLILGLVWSDGKNPPARLVDVDPYGATSSQLFFDSFQIGDNQVGVTGKRVDRFSDRDFFFARNLNLDNQAMIAGKMGVVWQTAFPKDQLTWNGLSISPVLAALKKAVDASDAAGLVIRFVSYRTQYFTNCKFNEKSITTFEELQAAYEQGFTGRNPAYSALLGNVGVWNNGSIQTGPSGSVLIPVPKASVPIQTQAIPAAVPVAIPAAPAGSKTLLTRQQAKLQASAAAEAVSTPTATLGPSQFRVEFDATGDSGKITLDFINAVPEVNQQLLKADLGSIQLQARDNTDNTKVTPLGDPIPYATYNREAYVAGGGVLTVPFKKGASALKNGILEVAAGPSATVLLKERPLEVVTDSKSIYLDEGQTTPVQLTVQDRGSVTTRTDLNISIAQYFNGSLITAASDASFRLTDTGGTALPVSTSFIATIPVVNGVATFQVSPAMAGTGALCYQVHPSSVAAVFPSNLQVSLSFSNIRNLPWDDSLAKFDQPGVVIPWSVVYENVLKVYDLVYPVMSLVIDLRNKQAVDGASGQFRRATALDIFESTLYMPITREMSQRKRNILWRYLQQVEMGGGASPQ
ncbi:MAG: hypothetical protein U0941_10130 [Planctomycetaceae bacterium]